jgi:hypothetical protein
MRPPHFPYYLAQQFIVRTLSLYLAGWWWISQANMVTVSSLPAAAQHRTGDVGVPG